MNNENEVLEILKEILRWTRFAGAQELINVLRNVLDTGEKRLIYHLSDGERGREEIANVVNVSGGTVRNYWISWFRRGIMEQVRVQRGLRYKKAFNIEDYGFSIPEIKSD